MFVINPLEHASVVKPVTNCLCNSLRENCKTIIQLCFYNPLIRRISREMLLPRYNDIYLRMDNVINCNTECNFTFI